jgi:hypothetical protein
MLAKMRCPTAFSIVGGDIVGNKKVLFAMAKTFGMKHLLNATGTDLLQLSDDDNTTVLVVPILQFAFTRGKVRTC